MSDIHTDYTVNDGFVQIPVGDFIAMQEQLEAVYDEIALKKALETIEEFYPADIVKRMMIDGENPVRVFREYRGFSQDKLANMVGVTKTTISEIENGRKTGSVKTLKAIAGALDVDLDEIV